MFPWQQENKFSRSDSLLVVYLFDLFFFPLVTICKCFDLSMPNSCFWFWRKNNPKKIEIESQAEENEKCMLRFPTQKNTHNVLGAFSPKGPGISSTSSLARHWQQWGICLRFESLPVASSSSGPAGVKGILAICNSGGQLSWDVANS